jgi:hypothetical protein
MDKSLSSFQKCEDGLWGSPILLFNGYRGPFVIVKWPEYAVNHSSLSSAEDKNKWSYTSTPPA